MAIENKILTFGTDKIGTVGGKLMGYTTPPPLSISNIILWLEPTEVNFIKGIDNKISQWNDISGNNRHLFQSTAIDRPLFEANVQNGRNGVKFEQTGNINLALNFASSIAGPFTFFVVWSLDANSTLSTPIVFDRNNIAHNRYLLYWNANFIKTAGTSFRDGYAKNRPFGLINNAIVFNNASSPIYENGILKNTINYAIAPPDLQSLRLSGEEANGKLSGYICEVIAYNKALSVDEISNINSYLNTKYGL